MSENGGRPRLTKLLLDGVKIALRDAEAAREASPDGAAAAATERAAELPADSFEDGVRAAKTLREFGCPVGENPLGPYICPPEQMDPEDKRFFYPFPYYWRALFRWAGPERVTAMREFFGWLTPARLAIIRQQVKEEEEQQIIRRWWRRVRNAAVAIAVAAFGVASWGVEQIPVVKELYAAGRDLLRWAKGG